MDGHSMSPPVMAGREVKGEPIEKDGAIYRLEYVPCGSPRCTQKPDLHGPYWYRYEKTAGGWQSKYIGKRHPNSPPPNIDDLERSLSEFTSKTKLTGVEFDAVRSIVADLARLTDDKAKRLYDVAMNLLVKEDARQQREIENRHRELVAKIQSGYPLTHEEEQELTAIESFMTQDH